ncbi:MAG: TrkA family potassium uptake protein [Candidatus Omnitrophica bacterium]|nr:TrkA family potassium uptake protein [Candidatus Omnitrophota bacterium]
MKQIVIIGLGNFGFYLAQELSLKGYEIIAIDKNQAKVQDAQEFVTQAIVADATDISVLRSLGVESADLVIVCIGSNLSDSILTTLNVKDMGIKKIYAKALSESHGRILEKLGASEVFFPEKDLAIAVARKVHNPNMIDYIPFIEGYTIVELAPPKGFIGKRLRDMNLINKYQVQVIAVKDVLKDFVNIVPTGEYMIKDSDILILLGLKENIERIREIS